MKHIKLTLAALVCALVTICASSSSAFASSYAYALAVIDYDSLTFAYTGTGSLTSYSYSTYAELNGESDSSSDEAYLKSSSEDSWAWSETFASNSVEGYEDIYTEVNDDASDDLTSASAKSLLQGVFTAETAGTLTISVNYYLGIDVMSVEDYISLANSSVSLVVGDSSVKDSLSYSTAKGLLSYDQETPWLTLTTSLDLAAEESVSCALSAETFANANAVPVPGTGLLLSAGLLAVAAVRRKN